MLKSLDLFSGYGGITLALEPYCQPIAYVEIEEYAQRIIAERMADGSLPRASILADVKNIEGEPGVCDIITGGFPCQDISVAGDGVGLEGKRSGLFFEVIRLVSECQPRFVFLENVPAITVRGLDRVLLEFTALGYDCRWTIISAEYVGAAHQRERWFLLAHANNGRGRQEQEPITREQGATESRDDGQKKHMANTLSQGCQRPKWEKQKHTTDSKLSRKEWLEVEPAVCRGFDGASTELDLYLSNGGLIEKVRILRCHHCTSQMEQWETGSKNTLHETKILQQRLLSSCQDCQKRVYAKISKKTRPKIISNNGNIEVRNMWDARKAPYKESCRWEHLQQSPIKHSYLLRPLSCADGYEDWSMGKICSRKDRLKALGNGVVPEQARLAFEYLMGIKTQESEG